MLRLSQLPLFLSLAIFSLVASALFHLDTQKGRELGRVILNDYVTGEMAGRLEVGPIKKFTLWKTIVHDTKVYDPKGALIITAEHIELGFDPIAALLGKLRFTKAWLKNGDVTLIDNGEGEPTFLDAFGPADPTPSEPDSDPFHAIVDDMRLNDVTVHGELLGLNDLRIEDMKVHGKMDIRHALEVQVWSAQGRIVQPFSFEAQLDQLVASIYDDARGTILFAVFHHGLEKADVKLTYAPIEGGGADDPYELYLIVHSNPVQAETLRALGFSWAFPLRGRTSGYTHIKFTEDHTSIWGPLQTDGGLVEIDAAFPQQGASTIALRSPQAEVEQIVEGFPDVSVKGALKFVTPQDEPDITRLIANDTEVDYEGHSLGSVRVSATFEETGIHIEDLALQYGGGEQRIHGSFEPNGTYDLHIEGDLPNIDQDEVLRAYVPDLRGSIEGRTHVVYNPSGALAVDGEVTLLDLEYGALEASVLNIVGKASGQASAPKLNVGVDGEDVFIAGYPIGHGDIDIIGGPKHYKVEGVFAGQGGKKTAFDAELDVDGTRYHASIASLELSVGDVSWRGHAKRASLDPEQGIEFKGLSLSRGNERLEASGIWNFEGEDEIKIDLQRFDLASLETIFADTFPELRGEHDLHLELSGDLDRDPIFRAEGTFREGGFADIYPVQGGYLANYAEGMIQVDAQVDFVERGTIALSGSGFVESLFEDPARALREGVYEIELNSGALDVNLLRRVMPPWLKPNSGFVDAKLKISGTMDAPSFQGSIDIPELEYPGWDQIQVTSELRYEYGALNARLGVADAAGELIDTEGSIVFDFVRAINEPKRVVASLGTAPWRFSARVPPREITSLPPRFTRRVPLGLEGLHVSGSLSLAGGAFKTRGDLHASFDWLGDPQDTLCATESRPRGNLRATLENDHTEIELDGLVGTRKVLDFKASAPTPLARWIEDEKIDQLPIVQLRASLDGAPIEDIPLLCHYAAGPLDLELNLKDLFSNQTVADLKLNSDAMRARRIEPAVRPGTVNALVETPSAQVALEASYRNKKLESTASAKWWNGGSTLIDVDFPFVWSGEEPRPTFAEKGPIRGNAIFDRMPLQAALAWMAGIANVEGILGGNVLIRGSVQKPDLSGQLLLQEGRVELRTVGQTLRNVEGQLIFDEDGVLIRNLEAKDGGGRASINGELVLKGIKPQSGALRTQADGFPIRREGSVIALIDGKAQVRANFGKRSVDGKVGITSLDVEVPDASSEPQDLTPHPEVVLVDTDEPKTRPKKPYQVDFKIDANKKFWVRSDDLSKEDFAAQATANLNLHARDAEVMVDGAVELHQGNFEVLGKKFEVQSGSMIFEKDRDLDPKVDLVAIHYPRGRGGDTITLVASGRLSNPEVAFSSTIPTSSESEVIALLLTGTTNRSRGATSTAEDAGNEAAGFLAGVAGGIFASTLRGELGGFAPTFGVETGAAQQTKVQVGFNVDALLPDEWKTFITGLYVEGSFAARRNEGGTQTSGQAQRPGFLVEAQLRRGFVSTVTFQPPANWSIDFTWEP